MQIAAHRSGPTRYPEQTIQSALLALACGADLIELDVRMTRDRQLAVCHDANALRVFGVDKNICEMTAQEFLALRHKIDPAFCAHLFEDYLRCGIEKMLIHVKEGEAVAPLLKMLDRFGCTQKVIIGATSVQQVREVKAFDEKIRVLAFAPSAEALPDFAQAGADILRLWEAWLTEETAAMVRETGRELWVMVRGEGQEVGVTTQENLKRVLSFGVDGILINDIEKLQVLL